MAIATPTGRPQTCASEVTKPVMKSSYSPVGAPFSNSNRTTLYPVRWPRFHEPCSVTKALPPVLALAAPGWEALVLVKPQFEAGRAEVSKGVVRDREVQRKVLESVIEAARGWGGDTIGVVDSGLPGPKGNREFFVHLVNRAAHSHTDDIDRWIHDAVGA